MNHSVFRLVVSSLLAATAARAGGGAVHVADFGAVPDDGRCDAKAIDAAIHAAAISNRSCVVFAAGTYLLSTPIAPGTREGFHIGILQTTNLALVGQTHAGGRPATRIERAIPPGNDVQVPSQIRIDGSSGIAIRNLVLANNPPLGSTAKVIAADRDRDVVEVEVLEGQPSYDGMRAASAHAWNLAAGKLRRFGTTPAEATLTIGTKVEAYWKAVPGTGARRLRMTGAGFAAKVAVGDGISWHRRADGEGQQISAMNSSDLVFENLAIPNAYNMGMLAGYNRNLTLRRIRFEPEGGNLAVGARDGLHLSNTSGDLLVEDCHFKGLRMDPLVIRRTFGRVTTFDPDGRVFIAPGYAIPAGDALRFWAGREPADLAVRTCTPVRGRGYAYTFAGPLPDGVVTGTPVSFLTHSLRKGVVRACVFEDNFGSAIVNFEENLTVERCTFDNNSYQVKYGPNAESGGFTRNNVFRDNQCKDVPWIDIALRGRPAALLIHSISRYFRNPTFNGPVEITGNVFRNPHAVSNSAAIDIRNARGVVVRGNTFEGFATPVTADPATTDAIRIEP